MNFLGDTAREANHILEAATPVLMLGNECVFKYSEESRLAGYSEEAL